MSAGRFWLCYAILALGSIGVGEYAHSSTLGLGVFAIACSVLLAIDSQSEKDT